jgi:TRAP-type C4-dicarboxylate transport system permease large subunit
MSIDPIYFDLPFVMNIVLGSITPPVGILFFFVSSIWNILHAGASSARL